MCASPYIMFQNEGKIRQCLITHSKEISLNFYSHIVLKVPGIHLYLAALYSSIITDIN